MSNVGSGYHDYFLKAYGYEVGVHHATEGAEGKYGDLDITYTEYRAQTWFFRARQSDLLALPEGEHVKSYRFYKFKADMEQNIAEGDIIEDSGVKYEVLEIEYYRSSGRLTQIVVLARRMKE